MERLDSQVVYVNPWMTVREDRVRRPDGSEGIYGIVEKPDFSLVLPRQSNGFWLVEQFRYPIQRRTWEFPQGSWTDQTSGTPTALAAAELAEETGLRAGKLDYLGYLYEAYGYSTQGFSVFVASELVAGDPAREITERDMIHEWFTDEQVIEMISDGRLADAPSVAALALFRLRDSGLLPAPPDAQR